MQLLADRETAVGSWIAVRLSDGGSDGVLYPLKSIAVHFQLHEQQCMYLKIPPDGITERVAARLLELHRRLYDAGMRLADPDNELEVLVPMRLEDLP